MVLWEILLCIGHPVPSTQATSTDNTRADYLCRSRVGRPPVQCEKYFRFLEVLRKLDGTCAIDACVALSFENKLLEYHNNLCWGAEVTCQ
jgi:hypothetical protein